MEKDIYTKDKGLLCRIFLIPISKNITKWTMENYAKHRYFSEVEINGQ